MSTPTPDEHEPMRVPAGPVIWGGVAVWVIGLVLTLAVPSWHDGERWWWPWACVTGIVLGVLAWLGVRRGRGNFSAV